MNLHHIRQQSHTYSYWRHPEMSNQRMNQHSTSCASLSKFIVFSSVTAHHTSLNILRVISFIVIAKCSFINIHFIRRNFIKYFLSNSWIPCMSILPCSRFACCRPLLCRFSLGFSFQSLFFLHWRSCKNLWMLLCTRCLPGSGNFLRQNPFPTHYKMCWKEKAYAYYPTILKNEEMNMMHHLKLWEVELKSGKESGMESPN